jgi:predicted nucleic acid-binding protein
MTIVLVDTSVFCELIEIPRMCSEHKSYRKLFEVRIKDGERFLLPMATLLETGNHIGQNGDGSQRRKAAERFVRLVTQAIAGDTPFTATPFVVPETLAAWLGELPGWVTRADAKGKGSGLGDLSIHHEWVHQCKLHPRRRVYVWSKDAHLSSFDRSP